VEFGKTRSSEKRPGETGILPSSVKHLMRLIIIIPAANLIALLNKNET
jgi:hypothetical protein